jgi:tetratricopeptide (TPR) repeat protein
MGDFCNRIIKYCLFLLVFLLPLFWLPFSFEAFEFNKQYLLFFLVSLAFFSWILKMVLVDKEIKFKKSPLDLFVLAFLFVAILSAIFSVDRGSSIFGFYGRFSDGLIGLVSLGGLYFLITNNVTVVSGLIKTLVGSVFFVILFSYLSIFGVWQKIPGLPAVMKQPTFNPVSGSLEGLSVFLSIVVVLLIILALQKSQLRKNWSSVILLIAALGLLFSIIESQRNEEERTLFAFSFQLPKEQVLNQGLSFEVAFRTATDNLKNGFLGSGIGTYFYDFSKFKPIEFNKNPLWQIRFDRPANYLSEILATMGFLGLISYLLLIGMFLLVSLLLIAPKSQFSITEPQKGEGGDEGKLRRRQTSSTFNFQFPILVAFLALVVSQFFYYQNTVLAFLFWLFLALSVVSWPPTTFQEKIYSKKTTYEKWWGAALLVIIGLLMLGSYYFAQQFYRADILYTKAQKTPLGPAQTALLEKAVNLNPNLSQYRIILARDYLNEGLLELRKPIDEQNSTLLQEKLAKAIDEARVSVQLSPNYVAGWETLGMVYRDIHSLVQGAGEWGVKAFEKAISLEPTNPILQTELGKLYLVFEETQKAKEAFSKAKELKSDYLDALLQEALIDEKENNLSEAIKKVEGLSEISPFDTNILFQLGRLYFKNNQIDEAISQFEKVVEIFPNHSNALYSLGVIWSQKGKKDLAIEAFEKVLELNPGNQDVIQKLKELKR